MTQKDYQKKLPILFEFFKEYKQKGSPKRITAEMNVRMFKLHNNLFKVQESNLGCPTCASRVFRELKQLYKAHYE